MLKQITTSWDDGHLLDFKLADLLHKYGLPATFYIPRSNAERPVMTEAQVVELSDGFEIGGHTLSHLRLGGQPSAIINEEVTGCYRWLKNITGKAPQSFCFPGGSYNAAAVQAVTAAGFTVARTTELLQTTTGNLLPTTLQAYPHSLFTYTRHLAKRRRWHSLAGLLGRAGKSNLEALTDFYLQQIEKSGGCFHLWGHSWEIEEQGLWAGLEQIFKQIAFRPGYVYTENKDLLTPTKNEQCESAT